MQEYLPRDERVGDRRDPVPPPAALRTAKHVHREGPLEQFGPAASVRAGAGIVVFGKSFAREVGEEMVEDAKSGLRSILYAGTVGALVGSVPGWIVFGPTGSLVTGALGFVLVAGAWTFLLMEA